MKQLATLITILCLYSIIVFGQTTTSGTTQHKSTNQDPNINYWDMMQDPNVNFKSAQKAFEQFWDGKENRSHNGWKQFKRWEYINSARVQQDGKLPVPEHAFKAHKKYRAAYSAKDPDFSAWEEVGPTISPANATGQPNGNGRINCVAFHPNDPGTMWAGSPSGGLWKTTNNGTSWVCLTDHMPTLGVSAILINPNDPNIILLGTGDRDAGDAPGMGVYKTTDGGVTWNQWSNGMGNKTVHIMIMHPSNPQIIIAGTSYGIYKTIDGGVNWSKKTSDNYYYKDLKYKPNEPTIVYATASGNFYRSTDSGESWNEITNGVLSCSRITIGVSPDEPDWVYILQASGSGTGFVGLGKSVNSGQSFTTQATTPNVMGYECDGGDSNSQSWYDQCIAVDPTDANIIHTGGVNMWKSTDGGANFTINSHWVGSSFGYTCAPSVHADIHSLDYSPLSGNLYSGNDGGVYYTSDEGDTWNDITSSLAIAQIYKIGQSQTAPDLVINGYQDNGTARNNGMNFTTVIGGDGMECICDYDDENYQYGALYYGDIRRKAGSGSNFYTIAKNGTNGIDESGYWVTPYTLHQNDPNTMFIGYKNVWRSNNVKTNSTSQVAWTKISSGESSYCKVIEHSAANVDILYVARGSDLQRTDNVNAASPFWSVCSNPGGNAFTDIVAHPTDPNIVYASQYSGVYKSTDKGVSWTEISGSLPNTAYNCLAYDKNSDEGLYLGSQTGVFYIETGMSDWVPYDEALPTVDVRELEIYYDNANFLNNKIKAATYGRGLWQSPLYTDTEFISLTTPNGGELWNSGFSYNITWVHNISGNVSIELYNNGIFDRTIETATPCDGQYEWTIPDEVIDGTLYTIKITSLDDNSVTDFSDGNFEIGESTIPEIAIIDLDGNHNSGTVMSAIMTSQSIEHEYHTEFPVSLIGYKTIFITLGVFSNNTVLSSTQGDDLKQFLLSGGNLYLEGGDTWFYDSQTDVHPLFNINSSNDGSGDLNDILGQNGAFTEGLSFNYNGDNSYIDRISPTGDAELILKNSDPDYGTAVSNSTDTYKTIGASFEFGGLTDGIGENTKTHLLQLYLEFFNPVTRPETLALQNDVVTTGEALCSEADDITVTGDGTTYIVQSGASQHLIATNSITLKPGFHAVTGSFVHALISTQTCAEITNPAPIVAELEIVIPEPLAEIAEVKADNSTLKIYPNPFSHTTTIEYTCVDEGYTRIDIMTLTGRKINTLCNSNLSTGLHSYTFNRTGLAKGVYLVVLRTNFEQITKKIVIN